jgi:hypothetical protein
MSRRNFLDGLTRPGRGPTEFSNPRHSPVGIYNRARLQLVGPDERGDIVTKHTGEWAHNVMNTYGLSRLVSLLGGGALNCSDWIGGIRIGTDSTVASSNDAALVASTASLDLTDAADVTEAGARTLRCVATFASSQPAGAATIKEIGLYVFSNSTSGLVNRMDLTGAQSVNKGASDSINVSMDIVFTTAA